MWIYSGGPSLFIRHYIPQIHCFYRQLRTQCTNLYPRGYTKRDTSDVSNGGRIYDDSVLKSRGTPVHRKDGVYMESMDPVVLKYTKMINEMRSKYSGVEIVNETNFGSIRFDDENVPDRHGHFDTAEPPQVLHSGGLEDQVTMERSDTQEDGFVNSDNDSSTSKPLRELPVEKLESGMSNTGELSYIDEVFFGNSLENLELNKRPVIDYSLIKDDLEKKILSKENNVTNSNQEREERDEKIATQVSKENYKESNSHIRNKVNEKLNPLEDQNPKFAYDYVVKMRHEEHKKQHGLSPNDGSNKSYKKILSLVNERTKTNYSRYEVMKTLKSGILYDKNDIVALHKPYGMAMHGGGDSQHHILLDFLPELADYLKAESLYPVHRLDASTTGVVLFARTLAMADTLKRMFKERQLKKTYWAITKAVPNPLQGIIDIPIAEGKVDGRTRMVLKPDVKGLKTTISSSKMAVTRFKVISQRESAALVELSPMTGVKHQLRVHMSFGLSCPVLGDHKYSHLKKLAPQGLPGDMLDKLKMKQSKVRQLPLFLHSKSIIIPEIVEGKNILIKASLPAFFNKTLSLLKLNRYESQVRLNEQMTSIS